MASTFDVLYLGVHSLIDPTEGNNVAENASALVGTTFGSSGSPLYHQVQTWSPGTGGYTGGTSAAGYDQNNAGGHENFRIDGGADQQFDALVYYQATITYADGTTAVVSLGVVQDTAGNTYVVPTTSASATNTALEAKPIESITLNSVNLASYDSLFGDRAALSFVTPDGTVDGTAGDDLIDSSFADAQGDRIGDSSSVAAGDGNDTVVGSANAETVDGGIGNDSIDGGGGNDSLDGGAGNDTLRDGLGADTLIGGDGDDLLISQNDGDAIDQPQLLSGGIGNDTIRIEGDFTALDTIEGGDGIDELQLLPDDNRNLNVNMTAGNVSDGTTGAQEFTGIENITTGGGNDTITGDANDNALDGGSGADTISGGDGDDTLTGGTGNDQLTGGAGVDTFVFSPGDGLDTITDFNTGNTGNLSDGDSGNNDFINLSGYYDDIWELHADYADDGILNQSTGGDYSDNTQFAPGDGIVFSGQSADGSSFTNENTGVICFTPGTMIQTVAGPVPVERLRCGDRVISCDNGPQPILWIGKKTLRHEDLRAAPHLRPISLKAGFLGLQKDMILSPQHSVLMRMPDRGGDEMLCRATHLARSGCGKIRRMRGCRKVTYIHILLPRHEVIFADGIATESLLLGPMALSSIEPAEHQKLRRLFPGLEEVANPPANLCPSRAYAAKTASIEGASRFGFAV